MTKAKRCYTLRLDDDTARAIAAQAERYGCSQGAWVEAMVAVLDESMLMGKLEAKARARYMSEYDREPEAVTVSGIVREAARWDVELTGQETC